MSANMQLRLTTADGAYSLAVPSGAVVSVGRAGSGSHVDLALAHHTIARHHVSLDYRGEHCTLTVLASPSGVFVNDQAVRAPVALSNGDGLRLGGLTFIAHYE
jgi:pSer/pThr/pTyr-binding forkhead associated (FHA) protein